MYEQLALYIDGEFLAGEGRRTQDVINPATLEVLGQLPHATEADLDRALAAAQRAFESWKKSSPMDRSAILRRSPQLSRERAKEIGRNMTLDQGKPLAEAVGEVSSCAEHADWHAEECRRIYGRDPAAQPGRAPDRGARAHRRARCLHALELPYNQAIRKIAAALGAGCTVVLKGPEDSPSAVMAIARMFHEAGLPKGCLNIVWGEPAKISDYLIRSPIVQGVLHRLGASGQATGRAGRRAHEARHHGTGRPLAGAGVRRRRHRPRRRDAGQVQDPQRRPGLRVAHPLYVQNGAYEQFLARFTDVLKNVKVGDGLEAGTDMGPLAHERRVPAMAAFVETPRSTAARSSWAAARWTARASSPPPWSRTCPTTPC